MVLSLAIWCSRTVSTPAKRRVKFAIGPSARRWKSMLSVAASDAHRRHLSTLASQTAAVGTTITNAVDGC
eukprot:6239332-Prymnesium_polylepis.2